MFIVAGLAKFFLEKKHVGHRLILSLENMVEHPCTIEIRAGPAPKSGFAKVRESLPRIPTPSFYEREKPAPAASGYDVPPREVPTSATRAECPIKVEKGDIVAAKVSTVLSEIYHLLCSSKSICWWSWTNCNLCYAVNVDLNTQKCWIMLVMLLLACVKGSLILIYVCSILLETCKWADHWNFHWCSNYQVYDLHYRLMWLWTVLPVKGLTLPNVGQLLLHLAKKVERKSLRSSHLWEVWSVAKWRQPRSLEPCLVVWFFMPASGPGMVIAHTRLVLLMTLIYQSIILLQTWVTVVWYLERAPCH